MKQMKMLLALVLCLALTLTVSLALAAGYVPDPARPVLGQHLASETVDRVVYLYAAVWVPILP